MGRAAAGRMGGEPPAESSQRAKRVGRAGRCTNGGGANEQIQRLAHKWAMRASGRATSHRRPGHRFIVICSIGLVSVEQNTSLVAEAAAQPKSFG